MTSFNLQSIKKSTWITLGVVLVLLVAAWYFLYYRKKQQEITEAPEKPLDSLETVDETTATDAFPLKKGRKGKRVEQLQTYLLKTYGAQFTSYGIDGIWGDETESLVMKFLKKDTVSEEYFYKVGMDKIVTTKFK
jgi:hypothetical protein